MPWLPLAERHRNAVAMLAQGKAVAKQYADEVTQHEDRLAQIEGEIYGKASGWDECDPCVIPRDQNPYAPSLTDSPTVPHVPDAPPEPGLVSPAAPQPLSHGGESPPGSPSDQARESNIFTSDDIAPGSKNKKGR